MVTTPESEIKKKIKKFLTEAGAYHVMIQGGMYSAPGAPDMVILYRGKVVWTEVKTPTGTQQPLQIEHMRKIKAMGGTYLLARSVDDVRRLFRKLDDQINEETTKDERVRKMAYEIAEAVDDSLRGLTDLTDGMYAIRDLVEEFNDEEE